MFLVVSNPERRERRWYGPQLAGLVTIGSAREADIQIEGHNISTRHVVLRFTVTGRPWVAPRVRIDVKNAFGVRVDGRMPRPNDELGVLTVGSWELEVHERVPRGIEVVDAQFLNTLDARADADPDALAVYADSLEERGRTADAEVVRGNRDPNVIARTPPEWRRSFLPVVVEGCPRKCERRFAGTCDECQQEVPLYGNIAAARERALAGRPVAVDPAVRRWPNDLKEAVVRQPAIIMGQPRR